MSKELKSLNTVNMPVNSQTHVESSRAVAQVQSAIVAAKHSPRDESAALEKILKACERKGIAEKGLYAYPKGGQMVTGPSIRLAEVIAQAWGNLEFGIVELEQKENESSVMAYAHDLESNVRRTKIFSVPHQIDTKKGPKKLSAQKDIYEHVANMGTRRERACILGIIPDDIKEAAIEACENTMKRGDDPKEVIPKLVKAFEELNVTQEMIETKFATPIMSLNNTQIVQLRSIYTSIKDGIGKIDQWFEVKEESDNGLNDLAK